ncbi:MAG: polysaccharide deacetylase family protein [Hellea sp.]
MSIYRPDMSLKAKVKRRLVPYTARRVLKPKLARPIVSFSFDDCPKSVIENAIKPLAQENWRSTVYIAMGLCGTTNHLGLHMSAADVKALHEDGHEIADHTYDHIDATAHSTAAFMANIDRNQSAINALGLPASQTFAYPYGQVTAPLKTALEAKFKGARGIRSRESGEDIDLNQIRANRLYAGADFETLLGQIDRIKSKPGWLPIFTHDIRINPSPYGCTPAQMRRVIDAVKASNAQVLPMAEAIRQMELTHD